MTTVGERLRFAIEGWGSIRAFSAAMRPTAVRGYSRPSIHRYLSGEQEPPLDFLQAAAEILGVRVNWLAFGDGALADTPIDAEQRPRGGRWKDYDREVYFAVFKAGVHWLDAVSPPSGEVDEAWWMIFEMDIDRMLRIPLNWGMPPGQHKSLEDLPEYRLDGKKMTDFALTLLAAVRALAPDKPVWTSWKSDAQEDS